MKAIILILSSLLITSSVFAGSIECTGTTIEDGDGKPARIIVTYKSFPHKLGSITVITYEVRTWKITHCDINWDRSCKRSHYTNPAQVRGLVTFSNVSKDEWGTDTYAFSVGKDQDGEWIGSFWFDSIMNPQIGIDSCKIRN